MSALSDRLRSEAEKARTSANGRHPDISVMTHAAALHYAANLVEETERADRLRAIQESQ